jgi:hypothetical protein
MGVGVVTVFFFEVVEPFFSRFSRLHPNTSLEPLLSSPSGGLARPRLDPKFLPRWAAHHVGLLMFNHVPHNCRQPTHHRHPGFASAAGRLTLDHSRVRSRNNR